MNLLRLSKVAHGIPSVPSSSRPCTVVQLVVEKRVIGEQTTSVISAFNKTYEVVQFCILHRLTLMQCRTPM